MAENPTTGELYKAKAILEADVVAAVDAFMADPTTTLFVFGDGYRLDLAAAVRSHPWAATTISTAEATEHLKRAAVRTAILLARPEKA
jgi:hypothetical protein